MIEVKHREIKYEDLETGITKGAIDTGLKYVIEDQYIPQYNINHEIKKTKIYVSTHIRLSKNNKSMTIQINKQEEIDSEQKNNHFEIYTSEENSPMLSDTTIDDFLEAFRKNI